MVSPARCRRNPQRWHSRRWAQVRSRDQARQARSRAPATAPRGCSLSKRLTVTPDSTYFGDRWTHRCHVRFEPTASSRRFVTASPGSHPAIYSPAQTPTGVRERPEVGHAARSPSPPSARLGAVLRCWPGRDLCRPLTVEQALGDLRRERSGASPFALAMCGGALRAVAAPSAPSAAWRQPARREPIKLGHRG